MRYSGIFLNKKSMDLLLSKVNIPEGWRYYGHHMTIKLGGLPDNLKDNKGDEYELTINSIGISETNIAFGVDTKLSHNKKPHITMAVDMSKAKPKDSNDITKWKKIKPFKVKGMLMEI